mmetsp:Transcript_10560/g.43738  ORF Transcript_10560/g.43738 Transcript_10560/m.43738 type:complete len:302 (-) Transcript_10560:764-1669(-)
MPSLASAGVRPVDAVGCAGCPTGTRTAGDPLMLPIGDGSVAGGVSTSASSLSLSGVSSGTACGVLSDVTVAEPVASTGESPATGPPVGVLAAGEGSEAALFGGDGASFAKTSTPSSAISSVARASTADLVSSSSVSRMTLAIMRANTERGDVCFSEPGVAMSFAALGAISSMDGERGGGAGVRAGSSVATAFPSLPAGDGAASNESSSSRTSSSSSRPPGSVSSLAMKAGTGTVVNLTGDRGASVRADLTAALSSATDAESAAILAMAGDCARAASALNAGVIPAGAAEAEAAGVRRYLSR